MSTEEKISDLTPEPILLAMIEEYSRLPEKNMFAIGSCVAKVKKNL